MTAPGILAAPAAFVPAVAVTLWLSLLGAAGTVLLAAGALAWWQRNRAMMGPMPPVTPLRTRRPAPAELARLIAEVDALSIQAVAAGITAADAEAAVATARARCRAAEWARERAWHEYDTAHRAYVSVLRDGSAGDEVWPSANANGVWPVQAAAVQSAGTRVVVSVSPHPPVPRPRAAPDADGDLAHAEGARADIARADIARADIARADIARADIARADIARAALATYRRGGISVEQLRGILRHSTGWNQLHARHEREVLMRRAAERDARRRFDLAAAAERSAYQAVDVATVAARAWADEAAEAAEDARLARAFAAAYMLRARSGRLRRASPRDAPTPALG